MATNQTTKYPISTMPSGSFDLDAYLELVTDDYGHGAYVNRHTTVSSFFDFLISSHAIFNKLDDVFNERTIIDIDEATNEEKYRYIPSAYISGQTYFKDNPKSENTTFYEALKINATVTKQQLEKFIHDKCLEVRALQTSDTAVQYTQNGWYKSTSDKENPRLDNLTLQKFAKPNSICRIDRDAGRDGIQFKHSGPFSIYSNSLATIFGKVRVPKSEIESTPYYSSELGLWVGVMSEGRIIAISELHNFDENGEVAYFSFQLPMSRDTDYYVVVPFEPIETRTRSSSSQKYKIFKLSNNLIYVLINDSRLEAYSEDEFPQQYIDAIATEEGSSGKTEDAYDLFSNIDENMVAVMYYSPVAKDTGETKTEFNRLR